MIKELEIQPISVFLDTEKCQQNPRSVLRDSYIFWIQR